jgi:hypothetical protein
MQTDAEREAEDRAGQRGDDLRQDQPGSDLLRRCTQRQRHSRSASRTVAKVMKIAVKAAKVTRKIVTTVSNCSARGMSGLSPPEFPK